MKKTLAQLFLFAAFGAGLQSAHALKIVENHQPRAVIVVPENSTKQIQDAAQTLQKYVQQSTGALLLIQSEAGQSAAITIGRGALDAKLKASFQNLDDDGFVLQGVDAKNYVIAGPTDWGTEFGVYEFLERFVGVRWLMPSEVGTEIPKHATLDIPEQQIRQQPAFWSRQISPGAPILGDNTTAHGALNEWTRRNRLHPRIDFHHNLLNLFPVSKYGKTHPEFYSTYDGKIYIPTDDVDWNWQPNFTVPGSVEEAAKNIKQYFRDNPEKTSYSLGMNDSPRFDETPASLALDGDKKNYLGMRDASNSFFTWANAVVAEVLKEYPDKWFGMLAYHNLAEPPTKVKPHPRIVPYLTYDRMKWLDPEIAKHNQELTLQWAAVSPVVGWYDYVYGYSYMVPREYSHHMQQYLNWGYDHNVRVHYAELYPNWGEGPKSWVYLKLQWNPKQNVDALLDDWYRAAVGPAAAPKLKEYFAIWEKFWTTTAIKSTWFTPGGEYLPFTNSSYLGDVDEADIARSRVLIDDAVRLAQTPQQKARAQVLQRAWDFYEASALVYRAEVLSHTAIVESEADALRLLERAPQMDLAARRMQLYEKSRDPQNPNVATDYLRFELDYAPALRGEDWGSGVLWRAMPWISRSPKVRARFEELAASPSPVVSRQAKFALQIADDRSTPVTKNPSFEDGALLASATVTGTAPDNVVGDAAFGWNLWKEVGEKGTFALSEEIAYSGKRSLVISNMQSGAPTQSIPFAPGKYYAIAFVNAAGAQNARGGVMVAVQGLGPKGEWIPATKQGRFENSVKPQGNQWIPVVVPFELKAEQSADIKNLQLIIGFTHFAPGQKMFLDNVGIYKLPE
jgi:hypothetical protein